MNSDEMKKLKIIVRTIVRQELDKFRAELGAVEKQKGSENAEPKKDPKPKQKAKAKPKKADASGEPSGDAGANTDDF